MKKLTKSIGLITALIGSNFAGAQSSSYDANPYAISGFDNTGLGGQALFSQYFGAGTGISNSAVGQGALLSNLNGNNNSTLGAYAAMLNVNGNDNVAIGYSTLFNNTNGNDNIAIGSNALYNGTPMISSNVAVGTNALFSSQTNGLTAIGYRSLTQNISGINHTAVGYKTLEVNDTGNNNTAVGYLALSKNTTGSYNTAVGDQSLLNNTTGSFNSGVGQQSLLNNTTGNFNSALGQFACADNLTGIANSGFGYHALHNNQIGNYNTACGNQALDNNLGSGNTAIGRNAFFGHTNGDNNTGVGYATSLSGAWNNATSLGFNAICTSTDRIFLGDANVANNDVWSFGTYNTVSDGRFKFNVSEEDVKGLAFIKLLRPVVYNFDAKKSTEFISQNLPDTLKAHYTERDFSSAIAIRQSGFIAQEVATAAKNSGYDFDGVSIPKDSKSDMYGIAYAQFVVPLVKAVQEQQAMIEAQQTEINALKKQNEEILKKNSESINSGINDMKPIEAGFYMSQNEPNPFTHETVVKYNIPSSVNTAFMAVYDLTGKQITTLPIDSKLSAITITSQKLAAGIYIYSIIADGRVIDSKRMVVAEK